MLRKIATITLLIFSAASANAVESQFYLKGSAGRVDTDLKSTGDFPDSNGYSLTFGYRLNKYFSLEAGRLDLGSTKTKGQYSYDHSFTDDYDGTTYRQAIEHSATRAISSKSITLGLATSMRITETFDIGLRLGAHRWHQTTTYRGHDVGVHSVSDSDGTLLEKYDIDRTYKSNQSKIHNNPYYGAFITWSIKNWALGLEHTIFEFQDRKPSLSALAMTYNF